MSISEDLRKLAMAGLGAATLATEKTQEALESLSKRGEEAFAQGKDLKALRRPLAFLADRLALAARQRCQEGVEIGIAAVEPMILDAVPFQPAARHRVAAFRLGAEGDVGG